MSPIFKKRFIKNNYFYFVLLFCISSVGWVLLGCNKAKDTTNPAPSDTTAPEISSITATSISSSQATINWTTNEAATSQVLYGLSSSYGSQTQEDTSKVSSHSMTLINLQSGSSYHYQI
ncbi:MAG: fibronectin type III domain-containing protein [bacterium]|nr:fibronectin type III domain-containing protein [bacterium]